MPYFVQLLAVAATRRVSLHTFERVTANSAQNKGFCTKLFRKGGKGSLRPKHVPILIFD